jgi:hypothetical protein
MLERWNFVKEQNGFWRWFYIEADSSITNSTAAFPEHGLCIADAKKHGWRWAARRRKLHLVPRPIFK